MTQNAGKSFANRKAVFLDRDGVIIEERQYIKDPEQVVLLPGAGSALNLLRKAGFLLVLVTNQSGVGRGYFTVDDVARCNARLQELLAGFGAALDRIYFAPEAPDQPSRGRKPSPFFLFQARDELGIDLAQSYMIGDKLSDLECGWNAGVRKSILVRTGYGARLEQESPEKLTRAVIVDNLAAAASWILNDTDK